MICFSRRCFSLASIGLIVTFLIVMSVYVRIEGDMLSLSKSEGRRAQEGSEAFALDLDGKAFKAHTTRDPTHVTSEGSRDGEELGTAADSASSSSLSAASRFLTPFDPSVDPAPHQISPLVEAPDQSDEAWASDFSVGAAAAYSLALNPSDLARPLSVAGVDLGYLPSNREQEDSDRRAAEGTQTPTSLLLPSSLTAGQVLMAELVHVWRQSQFAVEAMACALKSHTRPGPATERVVERHARIFAMGLETIARDFSAAMIQKDSTQNDRYRGRWLRVLQQAAMAEQSPPEQQISSLDDTFFSTILEHPLLVNLSAIRHLLDSSKQKERGSVGSSDGNSSFSRGGRAGNNREEGSLDEPSAHSFDSFFGEFRSDDSFVGTRTRKEYPGGDLELDEECVARARVSSGVFDASQRSRAEADVFKVRGKRMRLMDFLSDGGSGVTCVAPSTGQAIINGEFVSAATLKKWGKFSENSSGGGVTNWRSGIMLGAARLAKSRGVPYRHRKSGTDDSQRVATHREEHKRGAPYKTRLPVTCLWAFTDDAFAGNEFVVRALMRAPNLFIYAQSPTHSDFVYHVCDAADEGGVHLHESELLRGTEKRSDVYAPRLCLKKSTKEGFCRHPRILAVPHIAAPEVLPTAEEAKEANRNFLLRFSSSQSLGGGAEGSPAASAVRLMYRSSATGYPPLVHMLHHTWMGSNRDVFIIRQREFNRMVASELRSFFYVDRSLLQKSHTAATSKRPFAAFPSHGEIISTAFQLLLHYHDADRLRVVTDLNGGGGGSRANTLRPPRNMRLTEHLVALTKLRGREERLLSLESHASTSTNSYDLGSKRVESRHFGGHKLKLDVRISAFFQRPPPRYFSKQEVRRILTLKDALFPHLGSRASRKPNNSINKTSLSEESNIIALSSFVMNQSVFDALGAPLAGSHVPLEEQLVRSDFMLDIDGNSNAFNNLMLKLCTGLPVFKVISSYRHVQWYYKHLVNGKHLYLVPAGNALQTIREWLSNQTAEDASRVGRNGRRFCERYFLNGKGKPSWKKQIVKQTSDPWLVAEEQRFKPIRIAGEPSIEQPLI